MHVEQTALSSSFARRKFGLNLPSQRPARKTETVFRENATSSNYTAMNGEVILRHAVKMRARMAPLLDRLKKERRKRIRKDAALPPV